MKKLYEICYGVEPTEEELALLEIYNQRLIDNGYSEQDAQKILLNNKLSHYFESQNKTNALDIVRLLKDFRLKVKSVRDKEFAQVCKGGLLLSETDHNLQVKKYPHLYVIGENLNVAGMCGGYNLHFAFASAKVVADAIEREIYVKN